MVFRVLIAAEPRLSKRLARLLEGEGYKEVHLAHDCETALDAARARQPELIILDLNLPCGNPLTVAREILAERPTPIIVHSSFDDVSRLLEADEMGVVAQVYKPVTKQNLLGAIQLGMSRFRTCQRLHLEIGDCRETLRVRKLVERAKGILMKRSSMSEEEAFLKIQKSSRDNNITMEQVAQSIITADEVMRDTSRGRR